MIYMCVEHERCYFPYDGTWQLRNESSEVINTLLNNQSVFIISATAVVVDYLTEIVLNAGARDVSRVSPSRVVINNRDMLIRVYDTVNLGVSFQVYRQLEHTTVEAAHQAISSRRMTPSEEKFFRKYKELTE